MASGYVVRETPVLQRVETQGKAMSMKRFVRTSTTYSTECSRLPRAGSRNVEHHGESADTVSSCFVCLTACYSLLQREEAASEQREEAAAEQSDVAAAACGSSSLIDCT